MNQKKAHYLEFSGKKIYFTGIEGVFWIVIKSVCEALEVDYIQQFKNMQDDRIFAPRLCKHTILVPGDTQPRKYVCIPEKYVYGWILQIRSESDELWKYKEECYEVLYRHFHRVILKRSELYKEMSIQDAIISEFEKKITKMDGYAEYAKAKSRKKRLAKQANTIVENQNELFV